MHRFHLPPEECRGTELRLGEGDCHHAARVLRLGPGDPIEVLDGAGTRLRARIVACDRRSVTAAVEARFQVAPPPRIHLAPSLIKGRAMDFLIQKATELGACALSPLVTERSVVRVAADEATARVAGWRETAIEACKQCGNPWLPRLDPPRSLSAFLQSRPPGLLLIASLDPAAALPGEVLADAAARGPVEPVILLTGPEGDFTADEERAAVEAGAWRITLGPLVLRAETAVLAALAVLQHELRRRGAGAGGPG